MRACRLLSFLYTVYVEIECIIVKLLCVCIRLSHYEIEIKIDNVMILNVCLSFCSRLFLYCFVMRAGSGSLVPCVLILSIVQTK